ncbi:response regulator [candidate division KSB1 bacterium]|nr:response regulator [candidate division KSB1 bacterium]
MNDIKKILLIDDDSGMHEIARTFLKKAGYEFVSAFNGTEGLQQILKESPDLILLDYMMPDLNGDQVYQELISNPLYASEKEKPVIMLTARESDSLTKTRLLEGGIKAYLIKPFGLWELKNVLENIFITNDIQRKNCLLLNEIAETKEQLELLFKNAPIGILATNASGYIENVNSFLCNIIELQDECQLIGMNILEKPLFDQADLRFSFRQILEQGITLSIEKLEFKNLEGNWVRAKLKGVPIRDREGAITGLTLIVADITELEKKAYELSILREIGEAMQGTLNLEVLLHLILTCITAGCALGFSRSMLFLLDSSGDVLEGQMGVGPANAEDAGRIWHKLSEENMSLKAFLEAYGKKVPRPGDHFNELVQQMKLPTNLEYCFIAQTIREKRPVKVDSYNRKNLHCTELCRRVVADEFIAVPLIVKEKVIGVIVADNMYSKHPIDKNLVELLTPFASQAAVAIERAEAYQRLELEKEKLETAYTELKTAQERLLQAERLATIGRMAASVAHEIRNPLVTIGGFARNIAKTVAGHNSEELSLSAKIIADEVSRLEKILADVLDFTKLSKLNYQEQDINRIVQNACLMVIDEINAKNIYLVKKLDFTIGSVEFDGGQIKQVLINLIQNALYSMPQGGKLELTTSKTNEEIIVQVSDTGVGIPENDLPNLFNPFFTTKPNGTGLGLPITQQIISAHKGRIDVMSQPGKGTTFKFTIPFKK